MKTVKGDLIELAKNGKYDVIVHGCNCFHVMGAGIAKHIKREFPLAYEMDVMKSKKGDRMKLGKFTYCYVPACDLYVINAYTQYRYGPVSRTPHLDYDALRKCFKRIKEKFGRKMGRQNRFGIPLIGCGLAGGDKSKVIPIIEEEMTGEDIELVVL